VNAAELESLERDAKAARLRILKMICAARASHIGSAYSIVDVLLYLYRNVLHLPCSQDPARDRLVLSKGWASSAFYAVLAGEGVLPDSLLDTYCQDGSWVIGSVTANLATGAAATTGSMGHGLPIGVGLAWAAGLQNLPYSVYVVASDGECDEGSTWEACLQAAQLKLGNLTLVIDRNGWQSFGRTRDVLSLEPLAGKLRSFGWSITEVDGHNFLDLERAFSGPAESGQPRAVIANTVKGKGVSVFEDDNQWHYRTPGPAEVAIAEAELAS
jgi:transketolase